MPDFTLDSFYNKGTNFSMIKFGADAPLLETELNEMQSIQRERLRDVVKLFIPNGIVDGVFNYVGGVFSVSNAIAIIDGEILYVSNLTVNASEGATIYLKVWEKIATKDSTLKEFGNEQSSVVVPNTIMDVRVNSETSRRYITAYTLSTSNTEPTSKYLALGNISLGKFNKTVPEFHLDTTRLVNKEELSAIFVEID